MEKNERPDNPKPGKDQRSSREIAERELEALTRRVLKLKLDETRNFFAIGRELLRAHDEEMFRAKYKTFNQWLANDAHTSKSKGHLHIRIARAFKPNRKTLAMGPTRLDLVLRYCTASQQNPRDFRKLEIEVRGRKERIEKKPLGEASSTDIESALRLLSARKRERALVRSPETSEAVDFVKRTNAALKRGRLKGVVIALEPAKAGEPLSFKLGHIPMASASLVLSIVTNALNAAPVEAPVAP